MQLELELKADLWGLYMMTAAGYDFDLVIRISLGSIRRAGEAENVAAKQVRVQHLSGAWKSSQDLQRRRVRLSPDTRELKTLIHEVNASNRR